MDHENRPLPSEEAGEPEPASRHTTPAPPRINVVPHHPTAAGTTVVGEAADNDPQTDVPTAWVSASGLWPPLYLIDDAVESGNYRLGCGHQHDAAEPCDVADCHGQLRDDADLTYNQAFTAFCRQRQHLHQQDHESALLALWLIGYIVHRADPAITFVCLDWSVNGEYLLPGLYRTADREPHPDSELSDRLDLAINDLATSLTIDNEATWYPFTTNYQILSSGSGGGVEPDEWLDVTKLLTDITRPNDPAAATAPVSHVHQYLELSTAHLPPSLGVAGLDTAPGVIAHPTSYGWWLWVPEDPDGTAHTNDEPVPDPVLEIQRYARRLDCDYVLFDADADRDSNLPAWDW